MSKINPCWLTSSVIDLAAEIKAKNPREWKFGEHENRLAILADALMDAGCDDTKLLADLRWEGERFGIRVRQDEAIASICREAALAAGKDVFRCTFPVYDQHGSHGSGGWSRNAKHRPLPSWETIETTDVVFKGKSVIVNGTRRLKLNVVNIKTGEVVRNDYPETK